MAAPRKYPDDFRERAVRMVRAHRQETGQPRAGVTHVAQQLGVNPETLRNWVNEADVDDGQRPGVPADERARIAELEREVREPATSRTGPRWRRSGSARARWPIGPTRGDVHSPRVACRAQVPVEER